MTTLAPVPLFDSVVRTGDPVRYEATTSESVPVIELYRDFYEPQKTRDAIHRFLRAPIAARVREHKQRQLQEVTEKSGAG